MHQDVSQWAAEFRVPSCRVRTTVTSTGAAISVATQTAVRRTWKKTGTLLEKFDSRWEERPCPVEGLEGPCHVWHSNVDKDGYGRFWDNESKKIHRAHRWAFEHHVRLLESGEVPDHRCRVRACVNPLHLEAVSHGENSRRGRSLEGRLKCANGHDWAEHVAADTSGREYCRECSRERVRRYRKTPEAKAKHAARERERRKRLKE